DALVFTTGYQANVGAIGTLLEPGDTVIVDSGDHASIMDGVAMARARIRPFRHNRIAKLEDMLERAAGDGGGVLVVVDGVFSMEGDVAELPAIVEACGRHGARLMVDEAHGTPLMTPFVPVIVGDDWKAVLFWKALYDAGLYTNVALYPSVPRGGALLRTSLMATHEREHLDRALSVFERIGKEAQLLAG